MNIKRNVFISAVLLLLANSVLAQVETNPKYLGRFEFDYTSMRIIAKLDGVELEPNDGMTAAMDLMPGDHLLQIYRRKGNKLEFVKEEKIKIPAGCIVRANWTKDAIDVYEAVPMPGVDLESEYYQMGETDTSSTQMFTSSDQETRAEKPIPGQGDITLTVTTTDKEGRTLLTEHKTISASDAAKKPPAQSQEMRAFKPSKINFISEQGMCAIYLNGEKKAGLPAAENGEMVNTTISNIKPGDYSIKVVGADLWYEGQLDVDPAEELTIQVEPDIFNILDRSPLTE